MSVPLRTFHVIIRSVPPDDGGGGGGGGGGGAEGVETVIESTLKPGASNDSVMIWLPAPSVTGTFTVVQFCQPPVAGMLTAVQTLLGPLKPRCIEPPPPGDATRSWAV